MITGNLELDLLRRYAPNTESENLRQQVIGVIKKNIIKLFPYVHI
jgi:hypothetical protein